MFASNVVTSNRLRSAPLPECQNNCSCYDGEFFRGPTIPNETAEADQIERFYARNLPLSEERARNLQSFGSG
jgi:hypothetical protein